MNHPEGPLAHALARRARSPEIAPAVRSSTRKRTRIAGSKNLKNHEWVLVHQHFLRRNRENRGTVFVIHGVEYQWHNVRRKIIRASAALKEPLEDSESLSPLPWYIELRSPSPELIPAPPVASVEAGANRESSPQRPEEEPSPQSSHATSNTQSHDLISEDEEHDIEIAGNAFLGDLRVSEIFEIFRKPDWYRPPSSFMTICTGFAGAVGVLREDTLQTFVNRLTDEVNYIDDISHVQAVLELIRGYHVSSSHFLETVVCNLGGRTKEVLEWLASKIHIPEYGARALGGAAYSNNFEAVDTLLSSGVDINANVSGPHSTPDCRCQIRAIDYAQLQYFNGEETRVSDNMTAYLLDRGAEEPPSVETCVFGLLVCVLRQWDRDYNNHFISKLRSSIRRIYDFSEAEGETESFLETCIHETNSDNYLHMAEVWDLVERLLAKSDDISIYCNSVSNNEQPISLSRRPPPYDKIRSFSPLQAAALLGRESVVRILLQNGADVNCPARGSGGVTPLQAICWWNTKLPQDHEMKLRIVNLLLDKGANVNAAPAWHFGLSALQAAAFVGDKHVAILLVLKGADINAPACKRGGGTALAMAAEQGHAHIVRFLLNEGASIPPSSAQISYPDTTYEDNKLLLHSIRTCAPELAGNGSSNERPPRDYHEYEAEWAEDPTYDDKD